MLKYLVIVVVFGSLTASMSGQPNEASNDIKQSARQSQPRDVPVNAPNKQGNSQTDQAKANSQKWYAPIERPEWWLVILGFPTLGFVGWQAWETRKSAKATEGSLAAIKRQTKELSRQNRNMVEKERARIVINFAEESKSITIQINSVILGSFRLILNNAGSSLAYNVTASYDAFASSSETATPSENMYQLTAPSTVENGTPQETGPLTIDRGALSWDVPNTFYVYLRVTVTYNDIFHKKLNTVKLLTRREFMGTKPGEAVSNVFWEACGSPEDNYST